MGRGRRADTQVDIVQGRVTFEGDLPTAEMRNTVYNALAIMALTQIYPLVPLGWCYLSSGGGTTAVGRVAVGKTVMRDGVELTLLSASSTEALAVHLRTKGVALPDVPLRALAGFALANAGTLVTLALTAVVAAKRCGVGAVTGLKFAVGMSLAFVVLLGALGLVASLI